MMRTNDRCTVRGQHLTVSAYIHRVLRRTGFSLVTAATFGSALAYGQNADKGPLLAQAGSPLLAQAAGAPAPPQEEPNGESGGTIQEVTITGSHIAAGQRQVDLRGLIDARDRPTHHDRARGSGADRTKVEGTRLAALQELNAAQRAATGLNSLRHAVRLAFYNTGCDQASQRPVRQARIGSNNELRQPVTLDISRIGHELPVLIRPITIAAGDAPVFRQLTGEDHMAAAIGEVGSGGQSGLVVDIIAVEARAAFDICLEARELLVDDEVHHTRESVGAVRR